MQALTGGPRWPGEHLRSLIGTGPIREGVPRDGLCGGSWTDRSRPDLQGLRARIFRQYLQIHNDLPGAAIISGCWPKAGMSQNDIHAKASARIQERLQRRCVALNSQMITIVDDDRASELQRVARRSKMWNPVGSQFGAWDDGSAFKNIPNERLIEDPIFKQSHQSYFLQSTDFIAYALLKSEVTPTSHVAKYDLTTVYDVLDPICVKRASSKDPRRLGIVRT